MFFKKKLFLFQAIVHDDGEGTVGIDVSSRLLEALRLPDDHDLVKNATDIPHIDSQPEKADIAEFIDSNEPDKRLFVCLCSTYQE